MITAEQPVYAIGKQVQWLYPDECSDDKVFMMMDPLYIKVNFLNLLGNLFETVVGMKV